MGWHIPWESLPSYVLNFDRTIRKFDKIILCLPASKFKYFGIYRQTFTISRLQPLRPLFCIELLTTRDFSDISEPPSLLISPFFSLIDYLACILWLKVSWYKIEVISGPLETLLLDSDSLRACLPARRISLEIILCTQAPKLEVRIQFKPPLLFLFLVFCGWIGFTRVHPLYLRCQTPYSLAPAVLSPLSIRTLPLSSPVSVQDKPIGSNRNMLITPRV